METTEKPVKTVLVAHHEFPGDRWKFAILSFVQGVTRNKKRVKKSPKIVFDSVTLKLDRETQTYFGYCSKCPIRESFEEEGFDDPYEVTDSQEDVAKGFHKFVKDSKIKILAIKLKESQMIILRKGHKKNELFVSVVGFISNDEAKKLG